MFKNIPRWHTSIKEISEENWSQLLGKDKNPFFEWEWLQTLEDSESVSQKYGWQPVHLAIWKGKKVIGLAPLYLKNHSYGEFIFDQAFLRLSEDLGLSYYPKLIGMSPLSPIEGYKFFISQEEVKEEVTKIILEEIDKFAKENNILSCNFLYVEPSWGETIRGHKYLSWLNKQSQWVSSGERDFRDYLSNFNANQRRNIKRERKKITDYGITVSTIENEEIDKGILEKMHEFYEYHCSKWGIWGSKYLTCDFFEKLSYTKQKKRLVLFSAHRDNPKDPIGMSLCVKSPEMLWGRYWGSKEEIDYLHFEVCYYSPLSWAIKKGINKFDPGAGGSHKQRRGFLYSPRISLHKWYDKRMYELIKPWLNKVNKYTTQEIYASNNEVPFKSKNIEL